MLRNIKRHLNSSFGQLATANSQVLTASSNLNEQSNAMHDECTTVASASEQLSLNVNNIAAATEEMSTNSEMVTGNVHTFQQQIQSISDNAIAVNEGLSAVSNNAHTSAEHVRTGVGTAKDMQQRVGELAAAAEGISMIDLIRSIAGKTNLLALNRAGSRLSR